MRLIDHDQDRIDVEPGPQQPRQALLIGPRRVEIEQTGAELLGYAADGGPSRERQEYRRLAVRRHCVFDRERLARPRLAVDDAHGPRPDHVAYRPLAQRVIHGAHHPGVKVQEMAAHQSVSNPSSDTVLASVGAVVAGRSPSANTVVGSASAAAVAGDSP